MVSSRIHVGTLLRLCFKPLGSGLLVLLHPGLLWDGTEDKALNLWSGSTDSNLDYQRTNPREDQIVRTHTKESTEYKTQHHPATSSTLCRTPHLNNKQNKNTNQIISRQDYHLTQPCPSREKQTNKNSSQITLYEAYTNHWTNLRREETKRKKEFNLEAWEKDASNTIS